MQNQIQHIRLQLIVFEDLKRRHANTLLKNLSRVGWQTARHLTAHVRHMAEHGGVGNQPAVLEDRPQ